MSFTSSKRLSIVPLLAMSALCLGCVDLTPPWDNESVTPIGPGDTDGSLAPGIGAGGFTGTGPGGQAGQIEGYAGASGTLDGGDGFAQASDAALFFEAGSVAIPIPPAAAIDGGSAFEGPSGTGGASDAVDAAGFGGIGGAAGASGAARGGSPGSNGDGATSSYDAPVDRATSTGGKSKGNGGAVGSGGVVASSGGAVGTAGVVGSGGVGTGGAASTGGVVGTGGAVSTGGLTGGSSTVGTGGTWSYDCSHSVVPPSGASLLVTDFSDWNATTETWGRAGGIVGRIFAYPLTTSTMTAAVDGAPAGLHLSGALGSAGYGGGGIGINACASIAAFKQIEFTYYGSAAHCSLTWMVQTFEQRPTDQVPPGGCDRTDAASTICFAFPQLGVGVVAAAAATSPATVTKSLASFSGWSDAKAAQVIGLQWQFTNDGTVDDAGVGCAPDLTITSVRLLP